MEVRDRRRDCRSSDRDGGGQDRTNGPSCDNHGVSFVVGGSMICDVCGKRGARVRRMTKIFGSGRSMFLIEGVPVVCCPHCGESYYTSETSEEIDRIQKHRRKFTVAKRVPVAKFKGGA